MGLTVTLGHEFAGWLANGTPVAVEPLAPCGRCPRCRDGDYQLCVKGMAMVLGIGTDGGMAESCLVPPSSIVRLPSGVEPRDACLIEPLAVGVHAIRRGRVTGTDRVAIIGSGTIGLCAVLAARATGARVDLVPRYDHQRSAGEQFGAGIMVGEGYDVVVDAAGTTAAFEQCVTLARPGGRIVLLGGYWDGLEVPASALCVNEIDVIPSIGYGRTGPSRDIDVASGVLASNPAIAAALITHRFPLDAAEEAFVVASDRSAGVIKVVLEP